MRVRHSCLCGRYKKGIGKHGRACFTCARARAEARIRAYPVPFDWFMNNEGAE